MKKRPSGEQLVTILEALSDVTVVVLADFVRAETEGAGLSPTLALAELGVTVFPVGVVGEDEAGHEILRKLHEARLSTSGIDKLQKYATPAAGEGREHIHGEHPALLNLIEHARKFAPAAEAMYVCDHGIGAASPRVLNFIKSNRCLREKTLVARSLARLVDYEQLTSAVASENEIEKAIGIEIGGDLEKLAVAGQGMVEELKLQSFLAIGTEECLVFAEGHKPERLEHSGKISAAELDRIGAIFTAALGADASVYEAAAVALQTNDFLRQRSGGAKKARREELLEFVSGAKAVRSR